MSEVWQSHTHIHTEIYWKCSRERIGSDTGKIRQEPRGKSVKGLFDFFCRIHDIWKKKKKTLAVEDTFDI